MPRLHSGTFVIVFRIRSGKLRTKARVVTQPAATLSRREIIREISTPPPPRPRPRRAGSALSELETTTRPWKEQEELERAAE